MIDICRPVNSLLQRQPALIELAHDMPLGASGGEHREFRAYPMKAVQFMPVIPKEFRTEDRGSCMVFPSRQRGTVSRGEMHWVAKAMGVGLSWKEGESPLRRLYRVEKDEENG